MLANILRLAFTWLLRFLWDKAEEWYRDAVRQEQNRRVVVKQVKEILREAQDHNYQIAADPESFTDSLLHLRQLANQRREADIARADARKSLNGGSPFAGFDAGRANRNPDGVSGVTTVLSSPDESGVGRNSESERPESEPMGD